MEGGVRMGAGDESGSTDGLDLDGGEEISCTDGIYGGSVGSIAGVESWGWKIKSEHGAGSNSV
jgi:hypothetical protein